MAEQGKPKKSRKLIVALVILLAFSFLALYVMDKYIFHKKSKVHFTEDVELESRDLTDIDEPEQIEPAKPKPVKKIPSKPAKPKIKTFAEIMKVLKVSYDQSTILDWTFNIDKAKGKKLAKGIYSKGELADWDIDMHGSKNASRIEKGVPEFMEKPKEEKPKEESTGENTEESVETQEINEEAEIAAELSPTPTKEPEKEDKKPVLERIDPYSFKVIRFMPGYGDNGYFLDYKDVDFKKVPTDAPDFTEAGVIRPEESKDMFLPLGHGGSIVYEITGGELIDGDGPDFVIYADSAFTDAVETARVEVAYEDDPAAYEEFPCDSVNPPFTSCAGVHPVKVGRSTDELLVGGDAFDLAKIGAKKVRFIKITDTGDNKNSSDLPYTSGLDLDSIALIHAYKEK